MAVLSDEDCLNDLAFLTDIIQHLSELKLKLQGKIQLVNKPLDHICAFDKKFELFQDHSRTATLTIFTCLTTRKMVFPVVDSTNYAACAQTLRDEFTSRFPEFRRDEIKAKLFVQTLVFIFLQRTLQYLQICNQ